MGAARATHHKVQEGGVERDLTTTPLTAVSMHLGEEGVLLLSSGVIIKRVGGRVFEAVNESEQKRWQKLGQQAGVYHPDESQA